MNKDKDEKLYKGMIVESLFPYVDDSTKIKLRPSLIIWADNLKKIYILAFIGSKHLSEREQGDVIINKNDINFNKTGLIKDSKIKLSRLATLSRERITGGYGVLSKEMTNTVNKEIIRLFTGSDD